MTFLIAPSLLSADLTRLGEEIENVMAADADMIHFDVMDNHYVPNLTLGPFVCQNILQRFPELIIDVHLMANPVDELIKQFAKAGAKRISIHPDGTIHLDRSLALIQEFGCEAGLVLNPATSPDSIQWCINKLDFVLVMTVNPGFAGQKLIPEVIKKIALIKEQYPNLPISVDGGVTVDNIKALAKVGATHFVAGSSIFNSENYQQAISNMRTQLASL
ncbi:D-ribulose-5-phosphate-3-epimerase [Legionella busanensis]|uniref:Ribulose-phosphate 3-epimerase n=1 Tax=Legionella busanensis TaxID=190655 RepID=A0A378JM82_9GAMM|nr:ribulose-phosphate 3-epimerase [Legionella busanensis]STX51180.1 D-ribulose-5-phosphate-3-epimerase [Legionella busanensis]